MKHLMLIVLLSGISFSSFSNEEFVKDRIVTLSKKIINHTDRSNASIAELRKVKRLLKSALNLLKQNGISDSSLNCSYFSNLNYLSNDMRQAQRICNAFYRKNFKGLRFLKFKTFNDGTISAVLGV